MIGYPSRCNIMDAIQTRFQGNSVLLKSALVVDIHNYGCVSFEVEHVPI